MKTLQFCDKLFLMISIVAAIARNGVIGRDNEIPWRVRDDLVRLKKLIKGHTVILGRKTYDSLVVYYDRSGREMPARNYVIVTRDSNYRPARSDTMVAHSIDQAMQTAKDLGDENIFVIGGGGIFREMLQYTDELLITEIQADIAGDARFTWDRSQWREISREHHKKDDRNEYDFDFLVLERI